MTGGGAGRRMGVAAGAVVAAVVLGGCGEPRPSPPPLSLTTILGGADTAGFRRAVEPRPFRFPRDHGAHPDFRTEWWYLTGNLEGPDGRRVGYQFTLFRSALSPTAPNSTSAWATNQAYMAHLAVTDAARGRFHAAERFARGAGGLAGVTAEPFRAWLEDWMLQGGGVAGAFPLRLRARDGGVALDLRLDAGKPVVLQGERGLSRKGPEPGNASYYYSYTRMPTTGTVTLQGDTLRVQGTSWMDREWSTSVLPDGVVGWDWFALQLDDGSDLMVYALRRADGSAHPLSQGVLVDDGGEAVRLGWGDDVTVGVQGEWTSPAGAVRYPSGWRIHLPRWGWALDVRPVLPDQELRLSFRYWEGAVDVAGAAPGEPGGRGYVELTGYAEAPLPGR